MNKVLNVRDGLEVFNDAMVEIQAPKLGLQIPAWKRFSEFTGGLRLNEFTIFCAPTGAGKTQFLANLAFHLVTQGVKCFIAPVETGDVDFATRMLSIPAGVDLNTGEKFDKKDFSHAMSEHMEHFKNVTFSTHDNRVDVQEMVNTLKYMVEVKGIKFAMLDNLNFFLKPTRASDAVIEQDAAVHEFVMLAKKIPIHIFLVMHPKKTDEGKLKGEFDIKGTSTSVQEASNVLLMNKPGEEEIERGISPLSREFFFAKIRKRGFNVGKRFYLEYRSGRYEESSTAGGRVSPRPAHAAGNSSLLNKKRAGVPEFAKARSGDSEPSL